MATSGSKTVSVTSWDSLVFSWTASGQSVANNTTTVTWSLKLVATSSGAISSSAPKDWSVTVNGTRYSGTNTVGISNNSTKTLASGTTTIKHNDDGTKTFSYSFSQEFAITFDSWIGTISGSGSGTLNTIARASQPSCVTFPEHTQNVGEFGDEISIHMNRKSSSFTHTVRYQFGSQSGTIATGVTNGTTWTIPLTLMNLIPNALKGSGTIYVDTYNGSTLVGTKYCGFTATVPASVKPTCTVTVTDPTGHSTTYGNPVKGLSTFKVVVTPTLAYKSPIKGYNTTANGSRYTAASFTTETLHTAGTLTVSTTVTDQRGRTGSASKSLTVLDYAAPTITKLNVGRCDADGTANDQGAYVQVTVSATVTSLNSKNTATYTLKYKKSTATSYTTVTLTAIKNKYAVTDYKYVFAADTGSSYDVEVSVADNHHTSSRSTSASTAFTLMHWNANGTGMAIGKVSEKSNTLEVGLTAEFSGSTVQLGNRYSFASPGQASTAGYVRMVRISVIAANADTPITFIFTQRRALSPMAVHICFTSTATTSKLQSIRYEGSNYGAFLIQVDDFTWDLYIQKGTAYDTITLQEWWMAKPMESRATVTFPGDLVSTLPDDWYRATPVVLQSVLDCFFPVGYILILYSHADPNDMYEGTTWVRIENAFLWGVDASGTIGTTGGSKTHTLTVNELPAHTHPVSVANTTTGTTSASNKIRYNNDSSSYVGTIASNSTGGGQAHNNMPPYVQVSIWRRTA